MSTTNLTLSYDYLNCGRNGTAVRALASHQCGPDLITVGALCGLSLLLVLILCGPFFNGFSSFSHSTKNNVPKFQFDQVRGPAWKPAKTGVASSLNYI